MSEEEHSDPEEKEALEEAAPVGERGSSSEEEMPRVVLTRRRALGFGLFVLTVIAFFYFVLPKLSGVGTTVHRIERGDGWWIAIGVALELLSFAGYVMLFRAVFVRGHGRIGWPESYEITMAGLAATRLFAAAGAGGVALTAWALRRSGMEPRIVACRMVAFMVLLYVVFAGSLLLDGIGLGTGLFPGGGSFAITYLPAIIALLLLGVAGAVAALPGDVERRLERRASGSGRLAHWLARAVTVPALAASGVRTAIDLVRSRNAGLLGAIAWWGFDISVAVGDVPCLRRRTAVHGYLDGLLRRPVRQPAAAARWARRRRRRDDRRVRRLRRRLQPVRARRAVISRDLLLVADDSWGDRLLPAAAHGRALARRGGRAGRRRAAPELGRYSWSRRGQMSYTEPSSSAILYFVKYPLVKRLENG